MAVSDVAINNGPKASLRDLAAKYYAAFPALHNHHINNHHYNRIVSKKWTNNGNKYDWNGLKIIELMTNGSNDSNGLIGGSLCDDRNVRTKSLKPSLTRTDLKLSPSKVTQMETIVANTTPTTTITRTVDPKPSLDSIKAKAFYCRDIERKVLDTVLAKTEDNNNKSNEAMNDTFLVDDHNHNNQTLAIHTAVNKGLVDVNVANETVNFERLVNKFNSNIASIWAKPDAAVGLKYKKDNIWSFDSSFSSNQSSATPSPKPNAIDIWSSIPVTTTTSTTTTTTVNDMNWESNLLKSINAFPDDGFIDGNYDVMDDESTVWLNNNSAADKLYNDSSITLQNHQKNSPFIEFSSLWSSSTPKANEKYDSSLELSKLLSIVSLINQSNHHLSPPSEENLLTSPKTHFQPIKQDSFERDDSAEDDDSVLDITDTEVKKLVICSDKCPNNGDQKAKECPDIQTLKYRPLSTSLDELASFMGPFNDYQLISDGLQTPVPVSDELEFTLGVKDSQMSDKSTNTEMDVQMCGQTGGQIDGQMVGKMIGKMDGQMGGQMSGQIVGQMDAMAKLEPIIESRVEGESEPEYQDLYNLINEVLRYGNLSVNESEEVCDDYGYHKAYGDNHSIDGKMTTDYQLMKDNFNGSKFNVQLKPRFSEGAKRGQKPCTFFIEGHCKRSDCKYSHDISAITCKYWEEGFCFKAELCPFLHGYPIDEQNVLKHKSLAALMSKKSYAIESESDFPSLAMDPNFDDNQTTPTLSDTEPSARIERHFFDFRTKSVADGSVGRLSKAKLPITVVMKKKVKKRKDRNLQ